MIKQVLTKILAHKAAIALLGAAGGVVVTSILAVKDSKNYEENIHDAECEKDSKLSDEEINEMMISQGFGEFNGNNMPEEFDYLTKKERAIIFAKSYWRTGLSMAVTFGLMILSHRSMAKELTATAAALGVMTTKYQELDDMLKDKFPEAHEKVHKFIDDQNILKEFKKNPTKKEESYDGRNRYYEEFSKQIFYATEAEIKSAECDVNEQLINTGECSLFTYLASFPKSSGIKLEDWMKYVGWYEGDTSYSYNSGYFGSYVKPTIVNEPIIFEGEKINVNKIRWSHCIDFDPELNSDEIGCIESELEKIA